MAIFAGTDHTVRKVSAFAWVKIADSPGSRMPRPVRLCEPGVRLLSSKLQPVMFTGSVPIFVNSTNSLASPGIMELPLYIHSVMHTVHWALANPQLVNKTIAASAAWRVQLISRSFGET